MSTENEDVFPGIELAREALREYINVSLPLTPETRATYEINVVWAAQVDDDWKVFLETDLPTDIRYVVTHDSKLDSTDIRPILDSPVIDDVIKAFGS